MTTIWFERGMPPECEPLIEGYHVIGYPRHETADPFDTLPQANAIIAGGKIYDGAVMDRAPNLKIISRSGIGIDKISLSDASARGILVCNAPDAPTISTAEHAITLMLSVAKNIKQREKEWHEEKPREIRLGIELQGSQLGLIGFGRIGRHVARIAAAIGMKIVAYDPYIQQETAKLPGVALTSDLEELLGAADIVSLHLPLSDETERLMNQERFAQMKKGAILINTARGGIVDESALLAALESGQLYGAGLDVTDPEPPDPQNPLLHREDVIVTPHVASHTRTGVIRLYETAITHVREYLETGQTTNMLNSEILRQRP